MNPEETLKIIAEIVQAHAELYVALEDWLNGHGLSEGTARQLREAMVKSKRLIEMGD